ncbi:MAG: hypothetical protein M0C28_19915 [Candidatus Moduliflexus flocculans]|nr:hypothetical protein [Candidatus Moduliflexus flocculans]
MKILFIAMSNSIHSARWIAQIADQGWDLHLFPGEDLGDVHPDLKNATVHHSLYSYKQGLRNPSVKLRGSPVPTNFMANAGRYLMKALSPAYRTMQLEGLVQRLRPDIIHSMEFQSAGYLTHEIKGIMNKQFPPWIATNWGSDIFLYGRLPEHRERIKDVLGACDYLL